MHECACKRKKSLKFRNFVRVIHACVHEKFSQSKEHAGDRSHTGFI